MPYSSWWQAFKKFIIDISASLVTIIIILLGIGIFFGSFFMIEPWKIILSNLGAVILTSGIFTTIGTYLARTQISGEFIKTFGTLLELINSGVVNVGWWPIQLPTQVKNVDILIARAHGWISESIPKISEILKNRETKVRICIVSPNSPIIHTLAEKYDENQENVKAKILDSIENIVKCCEYLKTQGGCGNLILKGHNLIPTHTYYRFDDQYKVVWYAIGKGRRSVPLLELTEGKFADFFKTDFESFFENTKMTTLYNSSKSRQENINSMANLYVDNNYVSRVFLTE